MTRSKESSSARSKKNTAKARRERVIKRITVAAVAERQDILAQRVKKDRRERFDAYMSKIMPTVKGKARIRRGALTMPAPLKILAEGDSWFDYPLDQGGVIDHLESMLGIPICNMAHHGDEVRQIMGVSQRQELQTRLSDRSIRFDALLFSGGGNDLVGDQFCIWLNDFKNGALPKDLLNQPRLSAVLAVVEAGYRDLISIVDKLSPQTKIFLHGYDFPKATGKKVCWVGPWLKPSLAFRGIRDEPVQFGVVKEMLTQFALMLRKLADENQGRVIYVPTQETLQPTSKWWANEIHPTSEGFEKIAEVFKNTLKQQFPNIDS